VEGRVRECECKKRRIAQGRIREILKNWPEYKDAQLETFKPRSVRQQNAIRAIRENPTGSYFLGGYYQQGKTHLLVAQYRWMADAGMRCILLSAQELMDDLRKAETPMDGQPPYESPVLRMVDFAGSGHLFIDDIEKAPSRSGFRAEMLFSVLDRIKRRQLGLSVTSNLPLISEDEKDLRQKLTDEVAARIDQICSQIDM
jgi:DNA replication protein DnaC